jgi:hypothetical protein
LDVKTDTVSAPWMLFIALPKVSFSSIIDNVLAW